MVARLLSSFSARSRTRETGDECIACGDPIVADDHAVQLVGGIFHAGCVLYRPREIPAPPPGVASGLQPSR